NDTTAGKLAPSAGCLGRDILHFPQCQACWSLPVDHVRHAIGRPLDAFGTCEFRLVRRRPKGIRGKHERADQDQYRQRKKTTLQPAKRTTFASSGDPRAERSATAG